MGYISRSTRLYLGIIVFGIAISTHVTGCSVIGMVGGAVADAGKPRWELASASEVSRVRPADSLVVHLRDSTIVAGVYSGPARFSDEQYKQRYERWLATAPYGSRFPELNQRIEVQKVGPLKFTRQGAFSAFTSDGIETLDPPNAPTLWRYEEIHSVRVVGGDEVDGEVLLELRVAGQIPLATVLNVKTAQGTAAIPLDDVRLVGVRTERHGARNGFLLGLLLDAIVVVAVINAPQPEPTGTNCQSSPSPDFYSLQERARIRAMATTYRTEMKGAEHELRLPSYASAFHADR